jgi:hypothetical protein
MRAAGNNLPTQYELESRWMTEEGIPDVNYRFSDLARIKSGEHSGKTAEVIALISLEPEPTYVVILPPDEKSVVLREQELEATGSNAGNTLRLHKL